MFLISAGVSRALFVVACRAPWELTVTILWPVCLKWLLVSSVMSGLLLKAAWWVMKRPM